MTAIEKEIFAALADEAATLSDIADLYVRAHTARYAVFKRIFWLALDTAIEKARGRQGLDHCRRAALREAH